MGKNEPVIGPTTKISDLLSAWPELEKTLMDLSPSFRKLRNPILRKTIGKVATLQQIAVVGNMPVHVIINALRKEVGQQDLGSEGSAYERPAGTAGSKVQHRDKDNRPDWLDENKITATFNAIPVINAGENPMGKVFQVLENLNAGEIMVLITPFVPAPILDKLVDKHYRSHTVKVNEELYKNYILKPG